MLVNNAGVGIGGAVEEAKTKLVDMQLNVNLRSYVIGAREAIPMLKEAGAEHGKALIVNTASIAGKGGQGWLAVYSATKAGVIGFSQALQMEVGGDGIQVTALCPAFVDTPMTEWVREQVEPEGHDPARGSGGDGAAAAEDIAELPDPRGRLLAAGRSLRVRDLSRERRSVSGRRARRLRCR